MRNFKAMEILDPFHDLIHDEFCFRLGERMPMRDVSEQVATRAELMYRVRFICLAHMLTHLKEDVASTKGRGESE